MRILCLDASTPRSVIALGEVDADGDAKLLIGDEDGERANQASVKLVSRLEGLLHQQGLEWSDLDAIACGRGPGTFTGSRVAVATAKGLALARRLPVIPVSTLGALAATAPLDNGRILALLDARRGEVYGALFERESQRIARISEERCTPLEQLLSELDLSRVDAAFGPGAHAYREALPESLRPLTQQPQGPSPEGLWEATVNAVDLAAPGEELQAAYLRVSYAEMGINQPKRPRYVSPFARDSE